VLVCWSTSRNANIKEKQIIPAYQATTLSPSRMR
jgi:hypothetical protein